MNAMLAFAPPPAAVNSAEDWNARLVAAERQADRGDPREGWSMARALVAEARRTADAPTLAQALAIVAQASRHLADYPEALAACTEGIELTQDESFAAVRCSCLLQRGHVYLELGDYAQALDDAVAARTALAASADPARESRCHQLVGMVQARLNDFPAAQRSYEEALMLRESLGDPAAVATLQNSLGTLHLRIAQPDDGTGADTRVHFSRALAWFESARLLAMQGGDDRLVMLVDGNIASAMAGLGRLQEARERFEAQLIAARRMGDRRDEALILCNLGEAHQLLGQHPAAVARLTEALNVAEMAGAKARAGRIHLELAKAFEAANDAASALRHFKAFHALEREAHSTKARRTADALLLRSEIERVQREAERLRRDHDNLARANRQLSQQAREDPLTGLSNRRVLHEMLEAARQSSQPVAVALFDLDRFKRINDKHSHAVGDAVLRTVAGLLQAVCRMEDLPARLGGEEFVVLLHEGTTSEALVVAERVRVAVASYPWSTLAPGLTVTVSAGVAAGTPDANQDLLRAADAALYRAKRDGRNRVHAS